MLTELRDRAHFVTGIGAWERSDDDGSIDLVIENARRFIEEVAPVIGPPQITGGTTAEPYILLSLYWHIEQNHRLYGVYVRFKSNATWQLNWSGPQEFSGNIDNIPISQLSKSSIIEIYLQIQNASERDHSTS